MDEVKNQLVKDATELRQQVAGLNEQVAALKQQAGEQVTALQGQVDALKAQSHTHPPPAPPRKLFETRPRQAPPASPAKK